MSLETRMENSVILIVDDSEGDLDILVEILGNHYEVRVAIDGLSALQAIATNQPDLILLDIMMPGMDGFEVCRQLKLSSGTSNIPVLFISSLSSTNDKVRGFAAGALDYISKPIESAEVLARVKTHLTLRHIQKEFEEANQKLTRLASIDGLTQIANRRIFDESLQKEWRRACRTAEPLTIIMGDIDYFKLYNDHYGHQAGDDSLIQVARAISEGMRRPLDLAARYGGEEFVVMLPDTNADGAALIAQDIQDAIRKLAIPHGPSTVSDLVTISMGGCSTIPTPRNRADQLVMAADIALYQAKETGRNRYVSRPFSLEDD